MVGGERKDEGKGGADAGAVAVDLEAAAQRFGGEGTGVQAEAVPVLARRETKAENLQEVFRCDAVKRADNPARKTAGEERRTKTVKKATWFIQRDGGVR